MNCSVEYDGPQVPGRDKYGNYGNKFSILLPFLQANYFMHIPQNAIHSRRPSN